MVAHSPSRARSRSVPAWFKTTATIFVAAVLLGVLYLGVRTELRQSPVATTGASAFTLSIPAWNSQQQQVPFEKSPVFRVTQGATVTLTIQSARPGSFHVHGYEKQVVLIPGAAVTLTFQAVLAGRYPLHLHDPDPSRPMEHIATLEVQPQ